MEDLIKPKLSAFLHAAWEMGEDVRKLEAPENAVLLEALRPHFTDLGEKYPFAMRNDLRAEKGAATCSTHQEASQQVLNKICVLLARHCEFLYRMEGQNSGIENLAAKYQKMQGMLKDLLPDCQAEQDRLDYCRSWVGRPLAQSKAPAQSGAPLAGLTAQQATS